MPLSAILPLLQLAAVAEAPPVPVVQSAPQVACAAPEAIGDVSLDGVPDDPAQAKAAAPQTYILPETGFAFVIPGTEEDAAADPVLPPCEPVVPMPVRPRDPAIFGFYALPVTSQRIAARWQEGRLLELAENDALAASLSWGLNRPGTNPLELVNSRVNSEFRQTDDVAGDSWASATETLVKGAGDCEDLAILKLALLARAGLAMDDLFLVIVRDTARKIDHAVAAVRYENRLWVLDNRIDRLQPAERVMDYVPLQSFSGPWAWTYGYKGGTSAGRTVRAAYRQAGR